MEEQRNHPVQAVAFGGDCHARKGTPHRVSPPIACRVFPFAFTFPTDVALQLVSVVSFRQDHLLVDVECRAGVPPEVAQGVARQVHNEQLLQRVRPKGLGAAGGSRGGSTHVNHHVLGQGNAEGEGEANAALPPSAVGGA